FDVPQHRAEAIVVLALDTPDGDDEEEREVKACDGSGEARSIDAERGDVDGADVVAEDEEPVAEEVEQIGRDERDGDGARVVEGLQIAAQGEVKEERGRAPVERVQKYRGTAEDAAVDGKMEH